jgi:hypothetical protein
MLFVAFYILLNLVRQSARNPLWKFVIFSICLLSFSFSSLLFFASFCYVVDNLSISRVTFKGTRVVNEETTKPTVRITEIDHESFQAES